jgi:hypothetical protein
LELLRNGLQNLYASVRFRPAPPTFLAIDFKLQWIRCYPLRGAPGLEILHVIVGRKEDRRRLAPLRGCSVGGSRTCSYAVYSLSELNFAGKLVAEHTKRRQQTVEGHPLPII